MDKSLLVAYILKFFKDVGFKLCGSVPMGTRSIFHIGQRKELWVFKFPSRNRPKEFGRRPSSRMSRQSRGDHEA